MVPELEAKLLFNLELSARCRALGIAMRPAKPFGLEVLQHGFVRGLWSERHGRLVFRNLAGWDYRVNAVTPEDAIDVTIRMAEGNDWVA